MHESRHKIIYIESLISSFSFFIGADTVIPLICCYCDAICDWAPGGSVSRAQEFKSRGSKFETGAVFLVVGSDPIKPALEKWLLSRSIGTNTCLQKH